MTHLSDDDLVLVFYAEEAPAHLEGCAECRERLKSLQEQLGALEPPETPELQPDYEARVWARLAPRLEAQTHAIRSRRWAYRAAGFTALAASLVVAFLLGRHLPPTREALAPAVRERILLVAVGEHLERSQMVLLEILHANGAAPVDVSLERAKADDLVSANRLYRASAVRAGEPALAGFLEELEPVLVELARGPDRLSLDQLQELQRRIEARGILLKVRVIGSQARERGETVPIVTDRAS